MTLKLIPTEVKLPFGASLASRQEDWGSTKPGPNLGDFARDIAVKQLLALLAKAQGTIFASVGSYANGQRAQVANLSLGTSTQAASAIIEPLLKVLYGKNRQPTQAEIQKYATHMVNKMVAEVAAMPRTSPGTLFVIAAGNDGSDNDVLPVAPANLREPNTLTVAATLGDSQIAPFSNYGATMVDVAAPGVGILSSIPGGETLFLSGTSQAAPFVANAASLVLDANEALAPSQVREVLMGTVDSKPFLEGKVVSGGMVNPDRAVRAASLAKQGLALTEAIKQARFEIADARYEFRYETADARGVFALPLPSTFVGQKE
jgi:subtilisin family serine protease